MKKFALLILVTAIVLCAPASDARFFMMQLQGSNASWSTWNESSESGWSGMNDTNICLFENTNLDGDETSNGLVSGADLVYTSTNVPGATGSPLRRAFTGAEYFSITQTLADTMKSRNSWCVIMKFASYGGSNGDYWLDFNGNTGTNRIYIRHGGTGITFIVQQNANTTLTGSTATIPSSSTNFWVWIAGDGTNTYAGWSYTRPTVHTSVTSTQRIQAASFGQFTATGFESGRNIMTANSPASSGTGSIYYVLISQSALISY